MHLTFASPWLLGFLITLPMLWWLLRLTPPSPRQVTFPALTLLRDLATPEQTPAHTPWWLLLLRLIIAALVILACAQPLIDSQPVLPGKGAVLIAVDNDWAAARAWETREVALQGIIHRAERDNRPVILLPTARPADNEALQIIGPLAAAAAYAEAARIAPQPWPSDWKQAAAVLQNFDTTPIPNAIWMSSDLGGTEAKTFYESLQRKADDVRTLGDAETPVYLLTPPQNEGDDLNLAVLRTETDHAASLNIAAVAQDGQVLAHMPLTFSVGSPRATAPLDLPLAIRNQIARFEIEGVSSAATTALLDAHWQRRPVGLAGDKDELAQHSLLNGLFYIDRALKPFADIHVDPLASLLKQPVAVLILTDATMLNDDQIPQMTAWIRRGGILVRFAGDRLAAAPNPQESDLLPVPLRTGDRAMGGTLSWATPQKLHDFPAASPFHGLTVPADVTVSRQILADPSPDLANRTWAALDDGTPLVTAKPLGQGFSVLFHVPARSDWSNLPLSGLFVDMLRRIVDVSHGVPGEIHFTSLPPFRMLDAFGAEQKPDAAAQPLADDTSPLRVGPQHPPGLYGTESFNRAFNLSNALGQPEALNGLATDSYKHNGGEIDMQPYLLMAAFLLLLSDFLVSLWLRGIVAWRWRWA